MNDVLWLGGSPCAGKSTVASVLARRFGLDLYRVDEAFEHHVHRLDPARQPALVGLRRLTVDGGRTVDEVAEAVAARFGLGED